MISREEEPLQRFPHWKPLKRFTSHALHPAEAGVNDRHALVTPALTLPAAAERARFVRERLPAEGLFADHDWRTSPVPYPLGPALAKEVESLGRVLLQFYRAVNLLYRKSVEGKQPEWVARWLDQGKPAELIAAPALPGPQERRCRASSARTSCSPSTASA